MKGYKGTDRHMRCRGMQYEVGKTYHVDGVIHLCENGLHFCKNLRDVFNFYKRGYGSRYFEVEASGEIQIGTDKCAATDLTIVRELSKVEINRCAYGYSSYSGNGYGDGDGNGYSGNGYGNGYGYGYGGNGYGNGYGYGYGNSYGDGYGNGYGDGYGNSNGDGYSNGNIQKNLLWRFLS